jgi:PhnB protein
MHAALRIGEAVLMLSDGMPSKAVATGDNNFQVCLHFDDVADMSTKFDALAAGGHVSVPVSDTAWGAKFGMLTDLHGIRWMFNCERSKG